MQPDVAARHPVIGDLDIGVVTATDDRRTGRRQRHDAQSAIIDEQPRASGGTAASHLADRLFLAHLAHRFECPSFVATRAARWRRPFAVPARVPPVRSGAAYAARTAVWSNHAKYCRSCE